jgi:hypothetical protein
MPISKAPPILHLDASFENPASKTVFMRGRTVSVSVTAQQLHTLVMLGYFAHSLLLHDTVANIVVYIIRYCIKMFDMICIFL